jgi:hypothetical protein
MPAMLIPDIPEDSIIIATQEEVGLETAFTDVDINDLSTNIETDRANEVDSDTSKPHNSYFYMIWIAGLAVLVCAFMVILLNHRKSIIKKGEVFKKSDCEGD